MNVGAAAGSGWGPFGSFRKGRLIAGSMAGTWQRVEEAPRGRWGHDRYTVKERRLTFGRQYRIFAPDGSMVGYAAQKMFKLKEDLRVWADQSKKEEVLVMRATKVFDFNANFEVIDPTTGQHLGFLRRKGWSSLVRDAWQVTDPSGNLIATLAEDSLGMALLRRLLAGWVPYHYHLTIAGEPEGTKHATIDERFQIFGDTFDVAIHDKRLDPRLVVGLGVLMDAIEKARSE